MATERRPFPYWNNLRDYVQAELNRRRLRPAQFGASHDDTKFTPTITPFVRFTSTLADLNYKYKFFSMGLHGFSDVRSAPFVFDLSYGGTDVVGFAYGTDNPQSDDKSSARNVRKIITADMSKLTETHVGGGVGGAHPPPGVISVRFNYKGPNDFVEVTVTWKCYNSIQLEFLRPHFIMAGGYVVVEVGHQYSDQSPVPTFDWGKSDALQQLAQYVIKGRANLNDTLIARANGNYDMYIGQIIGSEINQLRDGTFEVVTRIASLGEALYGIDNHRLQGNSDDTRIRTIEDYFDPSNPVGFDAFLTANMGKDAKISEVVDASKSHKQFQQNVDKASDDLKSGKELDPQLQIEGTVFVSWEFFIHKILPDLFSHFTGKGISKQIRMITHINQSADGLALEPWVGNHVQLLSVDLNTMLIVKEFARKQDNTGLFANAEDFEDTGTANTFRGKLSKGVWLNAEVIRDSFLTHPKFMDSMKEILRRMNQASADYWNLDIIWDEDKARVVVYDAPHVSDTETVEDVPGNLYRFNVGTVGELLNFNFNAQFTKEVLSAIMLQIYSEQGNVPNLDGTLQGPDIHGLVLNTPGGDASSQYAMLLNQEIEKTLPGNEGQPNTNTTMDQAASRTGVTPKVLADSGWAAEGQQQQKELEQQQALVAAKFEKSLLPFVTIPSILKGQTSRTALASTTPNNYIAPIPTEVGMDLTFQGIGGIAFYDAFTVDKLPQRYTDKGLFFINKLVHEVTAEQGWRTSIGGQWYYMFHKKVDVSQAPTSPTGPTHVANQVDPKVNQWLDSAQSALGAPIAATSLFRTEKQNRDVGGSTTSSHLVGLAADFKVQGLSNEEVKQRLLAAQAAGRLPPFDQLIFEGTHVHIGLDPRQRGQILESITPGDSKHLRPVTNT